MAKSKLTKLEYTNDWYYDKYSINGVQLKEPKDFPGSVIIGDKTYPVAVSEVAVPYDDMGHHYEAKSWHMFVIEKVFGVTQQFDMNTIITKTNVYVDVQGTLQEFRAMLKDAEDDVWKIREACQWFLEQ